MSNVIKWTPIECARCHRKLLSRYTYLCISCYTTLAHRRLRMKVLRMLGGVCSRCGFGDVRALQIDHTNGGGRKDRARFSNNDNGTYYLCILRIGNNGDYQLLCANCNYIKRVENNELRAKFEHPNHIVSLDYAYYQKKGEDGVTGFGVRDAPLNYKSRTRIERLIREGVIPKMDIDSLTKKQASEIIGRVLGARNPTESLINLYYIIIYVRLII